MRLAVPLALTVIAAGAAMAAEPQPARCTLARADMVTEGDCLFTPRKGGSFDVKLTDRRVFRGIDSLSLDIATKGHGTLRAGSQPWGPVVRQEADPACWQGDGFSLCARSKAPKTPSAPASDHPGAVPARCHMDSCRWVDQSAPRQVGQGSAAVPGRVVEVQMSEASSEHPGGNYPDHAPVGLAWSKPVPVQYFCSLARPAFRDDQGHWTVLPLPEVFGATEGITTTYLRACHPEVTSTDPYEATGRIGYRAGQPARDSYPDFAALTRR